MSQTTTAALDVTPDAKIIDAAERFIEAELGMLRLHHGPAAIVDDDERNQALDSSSYGERLSAALTDLTAPASSMAGFRAKALAAATWDLDLQKTENSNETETILASLVRDLIGDYDPIAIAEGRQAPVNLRAPPPAADTPLQQLGRVVEDVERRHDSYDLGGSRREACQDKRAYRLMDQLHGARMALYGAACDQRAETAADLMVQLYSAFVIVDCRVDAEEGRAGSERAPEKIADLYRARTAIASALSVVLRSVDTLAAVPLRSEAANAVGLVFGQRPQPVEACA